MKDTLIKIKAHVWNNRGKYSALATAGAAVLLLRAQAQTFNAFLAEKSLLDEFQASLIEE